MPGSLLTSGYREFVLNNAQSVQSAENTLRSISYILPGTECSYFVLLFLCIILTSNPIGRFKNSEILSEARNDRFSLELLNHSVSNIHDKMNRCLN